MGADLKQVLLSCLAYGEERGKTVWLQQLYTEDEEDIMGSYLYENRNIEETTRGIYRFWMLRKRGGIEANRPRRLHLVSLEQTQSVKDQGKHQGVMSQRQYSRPITGLN